MIELGVGRQDIPLRRRLQERFVGQYLGKTGEWYWVGNRYRDSFYKIAGREIPATLVDSMLERKLVSRGIVSEAVHLPDVIDDHPSKLPAITSTFYKKGLLFEARKNEIPIIVREIWYSLRMEVGLKVL